jgi:tetratricopeptide (TPR) repeat protein
MLRIVLSMALIAVGSTAWAGAKEDCIQGQDSDRGIRACTELIHQNPRDAAWHYDRGLAYDRKGDLDRAVADFNRAIEIDPRHVPAYVNRGIAYVRKGDLDRAITDFNRAIEIDPRTAPAPAYAGRGMVYKVKGDLDHALADFNKAIEINPKYADAYNNRGAAYKAKGDFDRAIADYNRAIEANPKYARAYDNRGNAYKEKGDLDRAIADYSRAMEIDRKDSGAHLGLGRVYLRKGDYDRAIAELSEAMRLDAKDPEIFAARAAVYEAKGQIDRAMADYQSAVDLPERSDTERTAVAEARTRLVALERQRQRPQVAQQPESTEVPTLGRRVALVIGNSAYQAVGRLTNPANDARAIAASFRRLGFAEVVERYNTDLSGMTAVLRDFGDRTADADWAVVYYSGHGMEVNGIAYLIPVDARLERDTHVSDETVPLSRVLEKVETARKFRLVILDACRNNPFVARMIRSAGVTRAIGRGLAAIEPEGGVLVAYAAKHGTVAEDGAGANSPFAEAMLVNLEEPGLEINFLFRKVRDQVLAATNKRQEPFLYGSLPSESLFFKFAAPR